jgi:hypothetical protein
LSGRLSDVTLEDVGAREIVPPVWKLDVEVLILTKSPASPMI